MWKGDTRRAAEPHSREQPAEPNVPCEGSLQGEKNGNVRQSDMLTVVIGVYSSGGKFGHKLHFFFK